nr:unnamed protein product [Digitaria exilis]CAB3454541.1 unnamed protein product [Digitaria exilis]
MASTAGIKGEDSGEPDNDEQDGRGTCVHDDEKKHARKKKRGPPGGELTHDGECWSSEDEFCCDCSDDVDPMHIMPYSTHRDGSIYRMAVGWRRDYCIADRDESK